MKKLCLILCLGFYVLFYTQYALAQDSIDGIPDFNWQSEPNDKAVKESVESVVNGFVEWFNTRNREKLAEVTSSTEYEEKVINSSTNYPVNIANIKIMDITLKCISKSDYRAYLTAQINVKKNTIEWLKSVEKTLILDISYTDETAYITSANFDSNFNDIWISIVKDYSDIKITAEVAPELKRYIPKMMERASQSYKFFTKLYGQSPVNNIRLQHNAHLAAISGSDVLGQYFGNGIVGLPYHFIEDSSMPILIPHEISHIWWCGGISDEIWVIEGFAEFSGRYFDKYTYLDKTLLDSIARMKGTLTELTYSSYPQSSWTDGRFSIPYRKGAMVLRMLHDLVGDELFFKAVRKFYESEKPLTCKDFLKAINETTEKDYSWFFDQWFYRSGCPELTFAYNINPKGKNSVLKVSISQLKDIYRLNLPLVVKANHKKLTFNLELSEQKQSWEFNIKGKIDDVLLDPEFSCLKRIKEK